MGKPKRERSLPENEALAVAKNLRVSPRKLDLVAGLIRGKKVDHALADLEFSRKRIAADVRKCVMSAVANAENNHGLDVNELVVSEAYVGKNLVMKRFHARGRGKASTVLKPFSQITVIVRQPDEEKKADAKPAKTKARSKSSSTAKTSKPSKDTKTTKSTKAAAPAKKADAATKTKPDKAARAKQTTKAGKAAKETE